MIDRLRDIAEGNGDLTQRLENLTGDELGQLGKWVNTFIDNLHSMVSEIQHTVSHITAGASQTAEVSSRNSDAVTNQMTEINSIVSAMEEMAAISASEGESAVNIGHETVADNCTIIADLAEQMELTGQSHPNRH